MSTIRRQSIVSSFVVYFGFALGFLNTYLFTREGGFTKEQYGLTAIFIAIAQLMYSVANLGMTAFITKFFPYYKAHLPKQKNDQLAIALAVPCIGFLLVIVLGLAFKGAIINKVFNNSPELLDFYYWLFPFGFGYTIFMVLDSYAWQLNKAVLSNFLKEIMFRFLVTLLIAATTFGLIKNFETFIGFYSFLYISLTGYILYYLKKTGSLNLTLRRSIVTRKFGKKIRTLVGFVWGGGLIFSFASVIDTIFIAAIIPNGIGVAAIFTFGQYMTSLIQAPQRAVISAAVGPLSQAWKDKDLSKINRIYVRSSINQLLFSCAIFSLIWINFEDGIQTLGLQEVYLQAKWIFLYLGITRILDMGAGLNSQIISTSTFWRFEFITGLVLLSLMLPLNFILTRELGLIGPAIANLASFTVYNLIRYLFLLRRFGMQPFNANTLYTLLLAGACFCLAYFPFRDSSGWHWLIIRSVVFLVPYLAGMIWFKLSPDIKPVWETVKKRSGLGHGTHY